MIPSGDFFSSPNKEDGLCMSDLLDDDAEEDEGSTSAMAMVSSWSAAAM
jgi:hypothetical protein